MKKAAPPGAAFFLACRRSLAQNADHERPMNAPVRFDTLPRFATRPEGDRKPEADRAAVSGASGEIRRRRQAVPRRLSRRRAVCGEGQSPSHRADQSVGRRHPPFRHRQPGRDRSGEKPAARRHLPFHGAGAPARPGQGGVRKTWRHRFRGRQRMRSWTSCWPKPAIRKKLRIFVRLVAQLGGALLEMSSKYGCRARRSRQAAEAGAGGGRRSPA